MAGVVRFGELKFMKFKITMKDPDGVYECIEQAAKDWAKEANALPDEMEAIIQSRHMKLREICGQWFEYGEYLTVEIDTDAKTITVCPTK